MDRLPKLPTLSGGMDSPLFGGGKDDEEEKLKQSIANYSRRITAAGGSLPTTTAPTNESFLGKAFNTTLDVLDAPAQSVRTGIKYGLGGGNPLEGAVRGLTGKEDYTGSQFLKDAGVQNKPARAIGGFALDVLTDPLSYSTLGLGSLAKGIAKGAGGTLTREALEQSANRSLQASKNIAKTKLMAENNAVDLVDLKSKLKVDDAGFERILEKRALGLANNAPDSRLAAARTAFMDTAKTAAQQSATRKAGAGVSVLGKTLISGEKMQNAGAAINKTIAKVPVVGSAMRGVGEVGSKLFNASRVEGLEEGGRAIYSGIRAARTGQQNIRDIEATRLFQNFAKLQSGVKYQGENIDNLIGDAIQITGTEFEGMADPMLRITLTTDDKKQRAWNEIQDILGYGQANRPSRKATATVRDVKEAYQELLKQVGLREKKSGVLSEMIDLGLPSRAVSYFPRVVNSKIDQQVIKGGLTRNFNISNSFNAMRNPQYADSTIKEINQTIRDKLRANGATVGDDFEFLETSTLKAVMSRVYTSNKLLADREFLDNMIGTFGRKVTSKSDIQDLAMQGYDIVVPKAYVNVYRSPDVNRAAQNVPKGARDLTTVEQGALENFKKILENNGQALTKLAPAEAANFIGTVSMPNMFALPKGLADSVNKMSQIQLTESVGAFRKLVGKFYGTWKPLVTGLRPGYHTRNIASSTFNNMLDLGADMLNPATIGAAKAVMTYGTGVTSEKGALRGASGAIANTTHKIAGKSYTTKELYDLMVKTGALNTFFLTDAGSMAQELSKDIGKGRLGKALAAPAAAGRFVGNAVEEDVRALNFVAHMKQGFTPEEAAEMTKKFHFDYQDLTEFEQNVKLVLPFYTWLRKNLPLQLETFLNKPAPYLAVDRAQQSGAEVYGVDLNELPTYLQKNGAIPIGVDEKSGRVMVLDLGLPLSDLYTGAKDLLGMLSPLFKAPIELTLNKNITTGAPLRRNEYDVVRELAQESPVARLLQNNPDIVAALENSKTGRDILTGALYAKNTAGVLRDVYNYATPSTKDGAILTSKDMNQLEGLVGAAQRYADPSMTKYYDPKKGEINALYNRERELANMVQYLKDSGYNVRTIDELNNR